MCWAAGDGVRLLWCLLASSPQHGLTSIPPPSIVHTGQSLLPSGPSATYLWRPRACLTATSKECPCPPNTHKRVKKKFPGMSAGKESACTVGDFGLIPGSGKSAGEGIGYPLQYCLTSLVAQQVNNPPAMQENWVQSLGWEDPLEKGMATNYSILA